jgi:hypothetical protein
VRIDQPWTADSPALTRADRRSRRTPAAAGAAPARPPVRTSRSRRTPEPGLRENSPEAEAGGSSWLRLSATRALAKATQMAWSRSSLSPFQLRGGQLIPLLCRLAQPRSQLPVRHPRTQPRHLIRGGHMRRIGHRPHSTTADGKLSRRHAGGPRLAKHHPALAEPSPASTVDHPG